MSRLDELYQSLAKLKQNLVIQQKILFDIEINIITHEKEINDSRVQF